MGSELMEGHVRRAIDEGMTPAAVADMVAEAVTAGRFWVLPHPEFVELAAQRWYGIAEGRNPELMMDAPGMPSSEELLAEVAKLMGQPGPA